MRREGGDLIRQKEGILLRPFVGFCLGRPGTEHPLRRGVEDEKVLILVGNDDSIAHVGQNRLEDFVSARKLGGAVGYFLLQFVPTGAQSVLQFSLLCNISISPKPADDSP